MRNLRTNIIIAAVLGSNGFVLAGCEANVHDNTADVHDNKVDVDADLDFDATVSSDGVAPGESVSVTMNATGVVLVNPDEQPSDEEADRAAYFKIFLDDADSEPLVVTASASASVKIPEDTEEGDHKLICRLFRHDGKATDQTKEVSIKVKASASVMTGTAGATGDMM